MAPGFRRIDTPAMCSDGLNSASVASIADPADPTHLPLLFRRSYVISGIGGWTPGSLPSMTLAVCCCCAASCVGERIAAPKLAAAAACSISRRDKSVFPITHLYKEVPGIVILFVERRKFLQLRIGPEIVLNPDGRLRSLQILLDQGPR